MKAVETNEDVIYWEILKHKYLEMHKNVGGGSITKRVELPQV